MAKKMPAPARPTKERKPYPKPVVRASPTLAYDKLSAWKDETKLPELAEEERTLLTAFLKLTHLGMLPSPSAIADTTHIPKALQIRYWVDLHMKGMVQLLDVHHSGDTHIAVHPAMWKQVGVEKLAPPALPRKVLELLLRHVHPTGRTIYRTCVKWMEVFGYWPEAKDLHDSMDLTPDGVRGWLTKLHLMRLIDHPSRRNIFDKLSEYEHEIE